MTSRDVAKPATNSVNTKSLANVIHWAASCFAFSLLIVLMATWQAITTGGLAGALLHLAEPSRGQIAVKTAQGDLEVNLATLGAQPVLRDCGGLAKQLSIARLPALPGPRLWQLDYTLPATACPPGEHALWLKVTQEDGHLAWTSPVYLTVT